MAKRVETAVPVDASRYLPLSMFGDKLEMLQASGAVDYVHVWDQLMGWWPRQLWTPENSPLARFVGDIDSQPEAFTLGGMPIASASGDWAAARSCSTRPPASRMGSPR